MAKRGRVVQSHRHRICQFSASSSSGRSAGLPGIA
jgi:hypothetical protein